MALSDGAHTSVEEFSYFTLRRKETPTEKPTSLFGVSCSRQIESSLLKNRPPDVTRSTVQKAVVVVTDNPHSLGQLREKLSMVTTAWFAQRDFLDIDILKKFRESLVHSLKSSEELKREYFGSSLREMIRKFKYQTLILFKSLLLQPKILFFGSRCENLCLIQFSLISLIPGLMNHLEDCADPAFDSYARNVEKATSLKTSERASLLAYMGLPLQIFGKGSMFGPYTPLQQLDLLADHGTKSYVVGSTNSLLLQQKDRYSDILVNLDEDTVTVSSPSLRSALALSAADRRWIDFLTQVVSDTWDDAHPERPKTHGYMGSEEFIRLQFEEYLLALLSCMKYHDELNSYNTGESGRRSQSQIQAFNIEGDPALEFNQEFLTKWKETSNYALFQQLTSDALLYSIVEPRHPCAGGLSIDDIQRRLTQQISELHLDDRVREGREVLNKHLASGQKKVSAAFNSFWADIEAMREAQRKRNEEKAAQSQQLLSDKGYESLATSDSASAAPSSPGLMSRSTSRRAPSVDLSQAQASVSAVGQKASAYFSSWASWAGEKRKGWQDKRTAPPVSTPPGTSSSTSTFASAAEANRSDADSRQVTPRQSEDSVRRSQSVSRKKRWSNIILRRESGDYGFLKRAQDNGEDEKQCLQTDEESSHREVKNANVDEHLQREPPEEPPIESNKYAEKASTTDETKASPEKPSAEHQPNTSEEPSLETSKSPTTA
ncbi:hypothetical protein MAP00_004989 [Monascus purpureus]|nr:hypothetical protein MAP00_004989 [Monascus purpureus]